MVRCCHYGPFALLRALVPAPLEAQRIVRIATLPAPVRAYGLTVQPSLNPPTHSAVASDANRGWKIGLVLGVLVGSGVGGVYRNTSCHLDASPPCTGATIGGIAVGRRHRRWSGRRCRFPLRRVGASHLTALSSPATSTGVC
jgi:hypothetical protein